MDVLSLGSRGPEVVKLQLLLASALKIKLDADGDFGPKTKAAVVQFQKARKLVADGIVGPKTWAALGVNPTVSPTPPPPVTQQNTWLSIAQAERGIHEIAGPKANPRIIEYHATTTGKATQDEVPWCSSFVNWVMLKAGYRGTRSAAAISWLKWGTALQGPKAGAITVINGPQGNHVGFWVSENKTSFQLLGGNQSDQVKFSTYPRSSFRILGHRWPAA